MSSDFIKYLFFLYVNSKYDIPIYITRESYEAGILKLGKISTRNLKWIDEEVISLGNSLLFPFDVMHDAERTIGFRIEESSGAKVAIATDLGYVDNIVKENFKEVNVIVIECNYDYQKLMECSYPWDLKARVKGRNGHLSNNDCARFIRSIYHADLKKIYLAHMSKDSNNPKLALNTVLEELSREKIEVSIEVASQEFNGEIIEF